MTRLRTVAAVAALAGAAGVAGPAGAEPYSRVFTAAQPGVYDFAFAYRNATTNAHDNLEISLIRTNDGERVAFRLVDYDSVFPAVPSEPIGYVSQVGQKTHTERFAVETADTYAIVVKGAYGVRKAGGNWKSRAPDPIVESSELTLVKPAPAAPAGFVSGAVPRSARLSSALPARERLQLAFHQCFGYYDDIVPLIDCGATFNYQGLEKVGYFRRYDLLSVGTPAFAPDKGFGEELAAGEGRGGDADGKVTRGYSYSYAPYREACYRTACDSVKRIVASDEGETVLNWFSAWEQCGSYDYGPTSLKKFRGEYLPKKYGTIANLNAKWHAKYASFDEVPAAQHKDCVGKEKLTDPLALFQARASFIDFRDFCSKEYATWLGLKTKAIYGNDPLRRPLYSQYSSNNLGSICWLKWRPLCFEDAMQLTIKPSPTMGFDIYGTDDIVAENLEHYRSFGDYRCEPMVKEGNTHALGADLTVRTFWNAFAEGMKGWSCFTFQESPKPELRKFGMCDPDDDMAPRPKLAGVADMFRALGQVEPLLAYAKRATVGKPAAIYYSQTCNVMQERGYGSMFDCAPDSHNRVFELIRQLGYPCRIITDRQIQTTDLLDEVSCVFFCDAQYIPDATLDRLFAWVEKGGHVVADGQTGAFDGHGFPTTRFVDFLGIRPVVKARVSEDAARNLEFGYSDYAFEAVNHDELWLTMQEYLHQRAAKHPVAKKIGKIMFSAFGSQNVDSVAGENIILGNSGQVAWNVRDVGKGAVHYFAGYLGTIYGAGCTQYEWRDSHADSAPRQLFGALLEFAGASRNGETSLPDQWRYRLASPLVDKFGNQFNAITSFAGRRTGAFSFRYPLAAGAKEPKAVYLTGDRSRKVTRIGFAFDAATRTVAVTVPGLETFANVISVAEQPYPLLSVEPVGAPRGEYGLVDFSPGAVVEFKARLFNTTARPLAKGKVKVRLTDGWLCDRTEAEVGAVEPWGESEEVTFKVRAPAVCAARRLRPVNFVYEAGETVSTPSVEMVWFRDGGLK